MSLTGKQISTHLSTEPLVVEIGCPRHGKYQVIVLAHVQVQARWAAVRNAGREFLH
jgi:hypothetical protein